MSVAEETFSVVKQLPPDQARTVLDFARYLADKYADAEWEKRLDTAHTLPKFRFFIADAEREIAARSH
jgi:vancomycin permeability regulator SanA